MKRPLTLLAIGLAGLGTLAACSDKVDRDGTRDNIVEEVEAAGGTVDEDCIDEVFDQYSDDELQDFDDQLQETEPNEETQAFALEIFECVTLEG